MTPCDEGLLAEAVEVARASGATTLERFQKGVVVDRKADGTPVTEADRHAERTARRLLEDRFPDDAVVGEEESDTGGTSGRTWFVDPIDGTASFVHGVPLYSTLLAAADEEGPLLGVIHFAGLNETVWAGRGQGCWWDGRPAAVTDRTELAGSYLMTSGVNHWSPAALRRAIDAGVQVRTWGDAYGYALVATGRADAMVDPVAAVWDLAPMAVIVPEAGGRFTDLSGSPRPDGGSGLATNGGLHDRMRELLADVRPTTP